MRTRWGVTIALASLALLTGFDVAQAQQKRKAVSTSRPTPQFEQWTWLAEQMNKRTNGQLKMDVVSLPELGLTGFELVRVTRAGLVDVGDIILSYVAGDVSSLEGVDLPGLFPDFETSVKAHVAFLPVMKKNEDKLGGVVLGAYLWPSQYLFSRKPIKGPADLKGLKVRVYGTAQTEFARALGMEAVSIAFAETRGARRRGLRGRVRLHGKTACRCADRVCAHPDDSEPAATRRAGQSRSATDDVRTERVRDGWRPDCLWAEPFRLVPTGGLLR
jgi:TRAP-type C4-dicarboxylate transport system substrate-binding protein